MYGGWPDFLADNAPFTRQLRPIRSGTDRKSGLCERSFIGSSGAFPLQTNETGVGHGPPPAGSACHQEDGNESSGPEPRIDLAQVSTA
jgi:hypothetical protein